MNKNVPDHPKAESSAHKPTHNLPAFQQMLYEFAGWIRRPDPQKTPQNIERRRMNIYRELFLNNVSSFLENAFPVTKGILGNDVWQPLVQAFFAEHLSQSPYFREIPQEFMAWMAQQPEQTKGLPAWVGELLHYEWLELHVSTLDGEWPEKKPLKDMAQRVVQLSPFFEMAPYSYPVHTLSKENQPAEKPATPTFLMVYRLPDHKIRFMVLPPAVALLLDFLRTNPSLTPAQAAKQVAEATNHPLEGAALEGILADLHERAILF